jgi:hypothetical protein
VQEPRAATIRAESVGGVRSDCHSHGALFCSGCDANAQFPAWVMAPERVARGGCIRDGLLVRVWSGAVAALASIAAMLVLVRSLALSGKKLEHDRND